MALLYSYHPFSALRSVWSTANYKKKVRVSAQFSRPDKCTKQVTQEEVERGHSAEHRQTGWVWPLTVTWFVRAQEKVYLSTLFSLLVRKGESGLSFLWFVISMWSSDSDLITTTQLLFYSEMSLYFLTVSLHFNIFYLMQNIMSFWVIFLPSAHNILSFYLLPEASMSTSDCMTMKRSNASL